MVNITYDDKFRLINEDYLEDNINELLSLNEFIPYLLLGIIREIYVNPDTYSKWKSSIMKIEGLNSFYSKQKSLHGSFAYVEINGKKGTASLSFFLELLIFIELHPQFEGIIKDWNYLDELIDQCENEYNINIMKYINDYSDMRILLKEIGD